jgi:methionine-S-sulfoxide reductase
MEHAWLILRPCVKKLPLPKGCFWDAEAAFRKADGVLETVTGYTGGSLPDPGYGEVARGTTGHAETVGIVFDPAIVSCEQLLDIFFPVHDPTQAGGQGEYSWPQYRSVIFYHNEDQQRAAIRARDRLAASEKNRTRSIHTEIFPASAFWPAGECHQRFYEKCDQGYCTSRKIWE